MLDRSRLVTRRREGPLEELTELERELLAPWPRPLQRGQRRAPVPQRAHRRDPHPPDLPQAWPARHAGVPPPRRRVLTFPALQLTGSGRAIRNPRLDPLLHKPAATPAALHPTAHSRAPRSLTHGCVRPFASVSTVDHQTIARDDSRARCPAGRARPHSLDEAGTSRAAGRSPRRPSRPPDASRVETHAVKQNSQTCRLDVPGSPLRVPQSHLIKDARSASRQGCRASPGYARDASCPNDPLAVRARSLPAMPRRSIAAAGQSAGR